MAFFIVFATGKEKLKGVLVDKMCASNMIKMPEQAYEKATKHTRFCALEDACLASGYGIVTKNGKYIKFDLENEKIAENFLRSSKKKNDLRVEITGEMKKNFFVLKDIKELQ